MKPTYIYILQYDVAPIYKVGVTSTLERRIENLQTGSPYPLQLFYAVACKTRKLAYNIETTLHHRYAPFRMVGEWYRLTLHWLQDAMDILNSVGTPIPISLSKPLDTSMVVCYT